jgi:cyclopropane fatty-acyl-phospholipid synthase-like methyltransferase
MCMPKAPFGMTTFNNLYEADQTPWVIDTAQPVLIELAEQEKVVGDVLDLGCGTGDNSIMLAQRGHHVWGIDNSDTALATARKKQAEQKITDVTFIKGCAMDIVHFGEGFHTVIDSGFFHFLSDEEREQYLIGLRHVMFPHSRLFLLVLSDQEKHYTGPRALKRSELRHIFSTEEGFKVKHIEPTRYILRDRPEGVKAWIATIVRQSPDNSATTS